MTLSDPITIRPARDDDGAGIGALIAGIFADYPDCPFLIEEFPELERIATIFAERRGQMLVAEAAGTIVGSFGVAPTFRPTDFQLFKVYLARSHRGRGIADDLFKRAVAFARDRGARRLVLWTDSRFAEGHRFYERRGFARGPGLRSLHDAGRTLEFQYAIDLATVAG